MSFHEWHVYETILVAEQVGDRFESDCISSSFLQAFDSLGDATRYIDSLDSLEPSVTSRRRGLDRVEWAEYNATRVFETGYDSWEYAPDPDYLRSMLTDAHVEAMRMHEQAYQAFLDFERDDVPSVAHCLETIRNA